MYHTLGFAFSTLLGQQEGRECCCVDDGDLTEALTRLRASVGTNTNQSVEAKIQIGLTYWYHLTHVVL